jgi:hypothetical protein
MEIKKPVSKIAAVTFSFLYQAKILPNANSRKVFAIRGGVSSMNSTKREDTMMKEKAGRYDDLGSMR